MKAILYILILLITLIGCSSEEIQTKIYKFYLYEQTMIVNKEGINTIEGTYLIVELGGGTHEITINNLPQLNVNIIKNIHNKWMLGWGTNKPLYDAGVENLRKIISIDTLKNIITLGQLLRGKGYPENGEHIVLWNREPSGFKKYKKEPIIDVGAGWKGFWGKSMNFSSIIKDSINNRWIMYVNEGRRDPIQIYAAESYNLFDWKPVNDGYPLITAKDFGTIWWAGRSKDQMIPQTAAISDILFYQNSWHFIMDGYDKNGKRHIGKATAFDPVKGPFIISKNPIVPAGETGEWDDLGACFGKVLYDGEKFLMYYDGIKSDNTERLGLAISYDLETWTKYDKNPIIDDKRGWRSKLYVSEPAYINKIDNKIYLILQGAKKFKMGFFHHYITKRMYLDKAGNVDDNQLGLFVSEDGGYSFYEHRFNPIFVNDYADSWENEHLGAFFKMIIHNDTIFIFYQAKTSADGLVYKPYLRIRALNFRNKQ